MIFIDITDTIRLNYITGIQRVVRNVICYSIHDENICFVEYDPHKHKFFIISKKDHRLISIVNFKLDHKKHIFIYKFLKRVLNKKQKILVMKFVAKMNYYINIIFNKTLNSNEVELSKKFKSGDTLLLADSTWNYQPWIEVKKAKNQGLKIIM